MDKVISAQNGNGTAAPKTKAKSPLQRLKAAIAGKDLRFYDVLELQAQYLDDGVALLQGLGTRPLVDVVDGIQAIEHDGDKAKIRLEMLLSTTVVTPIDREDLHSLSSKLDRVLNHANGAARSCQMRHVTPTAPMLEMVGILKQMTTLLVEAVGCLRGDEYERVRVLNKQLAALETQGDGVYRTAITDLNRLDNPIDAKQLRREEKVLEDLELALNIAEDLAERLDNVAVKYE